MNQDKLNRFFKRIISEDADKSYSIDNEAFYVVYYSEHDYLTRLDKKLDELVFRKTEVDALKNANDPVGNRVIPVIHKIIVDAPKVLLWDDTDDKMYNRHNRDLIKNGVPDQDLYTKYAHKYDATYDVINQGLILFTPTYTTAWIDLLVDGNRERFENYGDAADWLEDYVLVK